MSSKTLPGRDIAVFYGNYQLELYVDMGVGIGGDKWPAAELFCRLIVCPEWHNYFSRFFRNKRVLELGSGNGLGGILTDKAFDCEAIAVTDEASHMKHIEINMKRNDCGSRCIAAELDWLQPLKSQLYGTQQCSYEIILALECVYREDLYQPLIDTILLYLSESGVCFLGSTREYTKPAFFELLTSSGLDWKKVPKAVIPLNIQQVDDSVGIFLITRKSSSIIHFN